MKAIVYTEYGAPADVLQLKEVATPTPKEDEVLVKVYAASVNAYDWRLVKADPFLVRIMGGGFFKPKHTIPGADVAGIVESVGSNVTTLKPGDAVFGDLSPWGNGGFAEYVCGNERAFAPKPANLTFEDAAAVPMAAVTALQGLRDAANVQAGQKVAINGAAGGVGTFAVQIAKAMGADVTAICSTRNLEQARAIGADHVIDYTRTDFTKNGQRYDVILAANGYHPLADYKRALTHDGTYVMAGGNGAQLFEALLVARFLTMRGTKKMTHVAAQPGRKELVALTGMLESGQVKPVVDRCYPFSEAAAAISYVATGHACGKVVISMQPDTGRQ